MKKLICCWGDSITEGAWVPRDETYPAFLNQFLGDDYCVKNAGSGGERTETILARLGARRVFLKNDVNFPAGCREVLLGVATENNLRTEEDETLKLTLYLGQEIPVNPLHIAGKEFSVRYENWCWSPFAGDLYLSRENADDALTLPAGTEVVFDSASITPKADLHIVYMGTNGKYTDPADLLRQHKIFASHLPAGNFLILAPHFLPGCEEEYEATFGKERVFRFREYLISDQAFADAGITPTEEDREYIAKGKVPPSFTYSPGDCHLSVLGYRTLAYQIGRHLRANGL